jgi:phosphopantothenoylcysteine decarboxylase/phosphopantothenate--cysteine ligase
MYEHPATQANLELLRARGARVVDPGSGRLASRGEWGVGRLADPAEILAAVEAALSEYTPRSLDGLRVLVTAGGTREPIDSVRFIGNRSSGRMGLALADEAARRGADVTLVTANVTIPPPAGVETVNVDTTAELEAAVRERFAGCDVLIMAAAPADFRPAAVAEGKLAREGEGDAASAGFALELTPTADIVAAVAAERRPDQTVVGFAAEHGDGAVERGRAKLSRKGLDAVVVNDISRPEIGFDSEENEVTIVLADGERRVARAPKAEIAGAILDVVQELRTSAGGRSTVEGRP